MIWKRRLEVKLIALQTKSMGWLKSFHEVEKGKWLEFVINRDKTIMVSAIKVNHLCDGGMSCSLFMNYPMDDVLDFVVLN